MSQLHHSIFEDQAKELYFLCDEEKKGFITKEDMYRLTDHLPLNKEQFESVFDSLDDDNNGNLTLEEFIVGFSKFLGAPVEIPHDDDQEFEDESSSLNQVAQEHLEHLIEKMKIVGLTEDIDNIKETWNQLQNSNAELLSHFETLIETIISDMRKTKNEYNTLEGVLKNKSNVYDEEMKRLYDEMDQQIKAEKERVLYEEKKREKEIKDNLEIEIREKDKLYQEILKDHDKTVKELQSLSDIHSESSQERERLEKEKNELENKLRVTDKSLRDCQEYIDELNKKSKLDRRNRAKAAIEMTEGIALERESLVRQLDELKEINKQLQEEKARKLGKSNFSSSNGSMDLFKELSMAQEQSQPKVIDVADLKKKRGSILSSYFIPKINVDQVAHENCQSINYEDDEDVLTDLGVSYNEFSYNSIRVENNNIIKSHDQVHAAGPSLAPSYQEMEIQTQIEEKLGERSPPDGAVEEVDIINGPEKPERIFKVVIIGDSSVGKTSIIKRFCNNEFRSEGIASTIGVDFQIKSIRIDEYFVALQIWDTAGQERFRSITSHYYRKSDGVVMVYDILSESSLMNLRQWMENVKEVVEDETVILVLANKCDMILDEDNRNQANRLKEILNVENVLYFNCSAKTGENINEAFQIMAKNLTNKENNDLKIAIKLETNTKKGCCGR